MQVMLHKWKERLSESSKGEWTCLLIRNLDAWLERGHGQMNFYLTQVMSGHGAFNAYLFRMKLTVIEEIEITMPGGTPCLSVRHFEYWEEALTALQKTDEPPLTLDSLVSIMLKSAEGWD